SMQISAEIRWFWRDVAPASLEQWFSSTKVHSCPPGGGNWRDDAYLKDSAQVELGVKRRGSKPGVEVKGLVTVLPAHLNAEPFEGPIELWTKWTSELLQLPPHLIILTKKQRWLRKFD